MELLAILTAVSGSVCEIIGLWLTVRDRRTEHHPRPVAHHARAKARTH